MKAKSLSATLRVLIFLIVCTENDAKLQALSAQYQNDGYIDKTRSLKSVAASVRHIKPEKKGKHSPHPKAAGNRTQLASEPRNFHFLPNATNWSLPVCFAEDISQQEQDVAIDSLIDSLKQCACATNRVITVASSGHVGSWAVNGLIDTAINSADDSPHDTPRKNARVPHSHARYYTLEQATTLKDCKQTVVYLYDNPIEVQLSLYKDIAGVVRPGGRRVKVDDVLTHAQKHAKHLECNKNNPVYHSGSRLRSELLKCDVFAIRDHFDGYMQSHSFPMLSMAYSAYHSPESMRVLATFVQTPLSAVIQGWQKADDAHNAKESSKSEKKGVEKIPRGEARLAALTAAERNSLLAALGRASQRTASFPEVCIWPSVARKKPTAHSSPNC